MAEGGEWGSAPMAGAQGEEGRVEVTEGAEEEEKGCVCGCGGEGGGERCWRRGFCGWCMLGMSSLVVKAYC